MDKTQMEINRILQDELISALFNKVSTDKDGLPWNSMFLESYTAEDETGNRRYEYRLKEDYTEADIQYAQELALRITKSAMKEIWK